MEACAGSKNPLADLNDFVDRVKIVMNLDCPQMIESANRVIRILKQDSCVSVDKSLFKEQAEFLLYEAVLSVNENFKYGAYLDALKSINPAVERFFSDVLVMDNDVSVKNNRLALLNLLKQKYEVLADFSRL